MKRSPLNKIGKIGKRNLEANKKLKELFAGTEYCEARLENCLVSMFLQFAHRHKRSFYRTKPELLSDYNQVIVMCQNCHNATEYNRELNDEVFLRLRGEE